MLVVGLHKSFIKKVSGFSKELSKKFEKKSPVLSLSLVLHKYGKFLGLWNRHADCYGGLLHIKV